MTPRLAAPFLALSLMLSACGDSGDTAAGNAATPAAAVQGAAAPAGKKWSEMVATTPEGGFVMGNPDAPVKLLEFGSFTCPHCREFGEASATDRVAMVDTGKLSFEYRPFVRDPLDMTMALIARCNGPEAFFPLSEQMFAAQNEILTKAQGLGDTLLAGAANKPLGERFAALAGPLGLIDFAKQRGLPEAKAKQCLSDIATVEKLVKQVQTDTEKFKLQGTPTLILNGTEIEGGANWETTRAKLREAGL